MRLRLTAPMQITFFIAFIVAFIAFLIAAGAINNPINVAVVWIALIAYAILALGNLLKGL
jgi:hypothetical protein